MDYRISIQVNFADTLSVSQTLTQVAKNPKVLLIGQQPDDLVSQS